MLFVSLRYPSQSKVGHGNSGYGVTAVPLVLLLLVTDILRLLALCVVDVAEGVGLGVLGGLGGGVTPAVGVVEVGDTTPLAGSGLEAALISKNIKRYLSDK